MTNELYHYGTKRHSGRYPYGSGEDPYQHESFMKAIKDMKSSGMSDTEVAKALGMSTTEFRAKKSIAKAEQRALDQARATELKNKGYSNVKIGEMMGKNESSIRALLDPVLSERNDLTSNTADTLKNTILKKGAIDIGTGVEREMGVSATRLKTAVAMLKEEGYSVYYLKVEQATNPGKYTTVKVLAPPDMTYSQVYNNRDKIGTVTEYSGDGGKTFYGIEYPKSIDSKRVQIRYGDEGGSEMDGVIQLRRNVEDISLGDSQYAQVRIAVDGTHYLKGMAMYTDKLPDGVDIIYNTNKKTGTPKEKVFKELKDDPDNPFGAVISARGQRHYKDANGKDQLSVINKVREEGEWQEWSKALSSQMLSKQPLELIKRQLNLSYAEKALEYDEIKNLTNPAVKKKLLESFADGCDKAAVDLKAAALPRQGTHVLLPVPKMKDDEIYAPNYKDGEKVALIRYPHGGTFEIPVLTVNNKQASAKSMLHNALDAVGINSKVAERLSGADFDGDTVMVIPTNSRVRIKSTAPLDGLKNFDPKEEYPGYEGMKVISNTLKQTEMGKVSNLITDMTLKGADEKEIARAVRHSMVVIDAEKHKLNYKQSFVDNGIAELKAKYQGKTNAGAATLISRAKSVAYVNERKEFNAARDIDPKTGKKVYRETGATYTTKNGTVKERQQKSTKMAEADDAFKLSSGTLEEKAYATYANSLKALANTARKEYISTGNVQMSSSAKTAYKGEVESLKSKLNIALKNAPRERQAQLAADAIVRAKRKDNPEMTREEIKKSSSQALAAARVRLGANKTKIDITDREWEAIQAGAVSNNVLTQILNNTDLDKIKERATPRQGTVVTGAKQAKIASMKAAGYTIAEISEACGLSTSTVSKYL